jgi:hypothetical protein
MLKYIKILILFLICFIAKDVYASTLQEYFDTGDNDANNFSGSTWRGQTWTTLSAFNIYSVKVLGYVVSDGSSSVTVHLRDTDSGLPVGSDLTSSSVSTTGWTTSTAGEWYEFIFSTPVSLSSATMYSLSFSSSDGDTYFRDIDPSGYSDGTGLVSQNAGVSFETRPIDFLFKIYSDEEVTPPEATSTQATTTVYTIDYPNFDYFMGFISFLGCAYFIIKIFKKS